MARRARMAFIGCCGFARALRGGESDGGRDGLLLCLRQGT